jgi:hypothetical protein
MKFRTDTASETPNMISNDVLPPPTQDYEQILPTTENPQLAIPDNIPESTEDVVTRSGCTTQKPACPRRIYYL